MEVAGPVWKTGPATSMLAYYPATIIPGPLYVSGHRSC